MKWYSIHNGKRIPYWLGPLIGLDQFAGSLIPGADVDRTISHRIGVKRVKRALRRGIITRDDVCFDDGTIMPGILYGRPVIAALNRVRLPFWRHPLAASIDWMLERIDPGHCIAKIGA
jgi:hypothetical protein